MPPLRVAITGVAGRLGAAISKALKKDARVEVVAGLDVIAGKEVTQTPTSRPAASACRAATSSCTRRRCQVPSRTPPPGVDATLGARLESANIIGLEDAASATSSSTTSRRRCECSRPRQTPARRASCCRRARSRWAGRPCVLPRRCPSPTTRRRGRTRRYGLSKALGDEIGASYARSSGLEVRSLRFTNDRQAGSSTTCHGRTRTTYHYYSGRGATRTTSSTRTIARRRPRRGVWGRTRYTSLLVAAASTRFAQSNGGLAGGTLRRPAPAFRGASSDSILDAPLAARALGPGGRGAGVVETASRRRRPSRRATILRSSTSTLVGSSSRRARRCRSTPGSPIECFPTARAARAAAHQLRRRAHGRSRPQHARRGLR